MSALVSYTIRYLPLFVALLLCPIVVLLRCVCHHCNMTECICIVYTYLPCLLSSMVARFIEYISSVHTQARPVCKVLPDIQLLLIAFRSAAFLLQCHGNIIVHCMSSTIFNLICTSSHVLGSADCGCSTNMGYGGSSSSSTLIWCTLPCPSWTALCYETPVTRLSDL